MEYLAWIDAHKDDLVAFLRDLISFESIASPTDDDGAPQGKNVADCLEFALGKARSFGLCTENFHGWAGLIDSEKTAQTPKIGVLCHLDVVPAGEGWDTPPFTASIRDDVLYGRGATDDKGPFASALFALAALKQTGVGLPGGVRLICGTCEETGSEDMAFCARHGVIPETVFSPDADYPVVNTEKGIARFTIRAPLSDSALLELNGGEVINMVAPVASARVRGLDGDRAEKALNALGDARLTLSIDGDVLTLRGVGAHASLPQDGVNAISALCAVLCSVLPENDPALGVLDALRALFPHGESDGAGFGIACSDALSGALTLNLGLCGYRDGFLEFCFDTRFCLCASGESVREKIESALSGTPFSLASYSAIEPHHVPEDSKLVKALIAAYERFTGQKGNCLAIGGGTYVHELAGGVAFGPVFPGEDNRIHCANEFVRIPQLVQNAKMIAAAILDLAQV